MSDGLKIIHFNTQGFLSKLSSINDFVQTNGPDIFVITEHFEKNNKDLDALDGYKIVNSFCRKQNERGGVAIWAKDKIPCRPRKDLDRHREEGELELTSVCVGEDVVVTGAYRPLTSNMSMFNMRLQKLVSKISKETHIKHILTGDFNVDIREPNKTNSLLNNYEMVFHINKGTHKSGKCVDNFITNFYAANSRVIVSKKSNISRHYPIELIIDKDATPITNKTDPNLFKVFTSLFDANVAELKVQNMRHSKTNQLSPLDTDDDPSSSRFNNISNTTSNNDRDVTSSVITKVFKYISPFHTSQSNLRDDLSNTAKKIEVQHSEVNKAIVNTSFLKKLYKLIVFAFRLFTNKESGI